MRFSLTGAKGDNPHAAMGPLHCLYLLIFLSQIQPVVSPIHLASLLKPRQTCFDQTGFELATLQQIWDTYNNYGGSVPGTFGGQLAAPVRSGLMTCAYHFFCVFIYIHKCPQTNWEESFDLPGGYSMSYNNRQPMWDVAEALSNIVSEIHYNDRLDPYNHVGQPFKYHVTGIHMHRIAPSTLPTYPHPPHPLDRNCGCIPHLCACIT